MIVLCASLFGENAELNIPYKASKTKAPGIDFQLQFHNTSFT